MRARIRKSMQEKDQGFTLIELLVVMIIIGILAAIAIPVFTSQRQKAVDASIKSDIKTAATAVETSFVDTQAYPVQAAGTTLLGTVQKTTGNTLVYKEITNGYCVSGYATGKGSANAANVAFWYVSTAGGLQTGAAGAAPAACA